MNLREKLRETRPLHVLTAATLLWAAGCGSDPIENTELPKPIYYDDGSATIFLRAPDGTPQRVGATCVAAGQLFLDREGEAGDRLATSSACDDLRITPTELGGGNPTIG